MGGRGALHPFLGEKRRLTRNVARWEPCDSLKCVLIEYFILDNVPIEYYNIIVSRSQTFNQKERKAAMNKTPIEHEDLKAAIAELGGQKAVANRFGIPYRTVQNWYRGERTPEYVARMIIMFNADEIEHLETKEKERGPLRETKPTERGTSRTKKR